MLAQVIRAGVGTVVVLAFQAACSMGDESGVYVPWTAEEEHRGDTLVVRTLAGSVWRDTVELIPETVIGELDGEEPYLFGRIGGLDVGEDGEILVVDRQARQVRVFSAEGRHQFSFGRAGEGPGEFTNPDHVRRMPDGRMVVRDQPGRFSVFSPEGEYVGGWNLDSGFGTGTPFFLDGRGGVLNQTFSDRLVHYALDGAPGDTVPVPRRGYSPPDLHVPVSGGEARYSIPFMPAEHWTVTDTGHVVFGNSERYRVERWEGTAVLRIERVADPVPVGGEEATRAREATIQTIRQLDPGWQWRGPDIPSRKPFFRSLLSGRDGSIWVIRPTRGVESENPQWDPSRPDTGPRSFWREPVVADVFGPDGRYLGPVRIPELVSLWPIPVVTADRIWAVMQHELGFPQVVGFRLEVLRGVSRGRE